MLEINQRHRNQVVVWALLVAVAVPSQAADLLTPAQASRLGLEEAWRRQLQVPAGAQSIVDQELYVVEGAELEYVEVTAAEGKPDPTLASVNKAGEFNGVSGPSPEGAKVYARYRVDQNGAAGHAMEKAEAERRARQQIRVLARRGIAAKITTSKAPIVRLYTLGDDGTLQCQDAETGELIWLARFGKRFRGYGELGVSNDKVTVINGSSLIEVDAKNGEEIISEPMTSVPLFGAVHAGEYALIPIIRGGVECHRLDDPTEVPFVELVAGTALAMPIAAPNSNKVAWGTDRGYVYVIELSGTPSTLFRLNTDGIVSGMIGVASGERFFFGSESGQVYGVQATNREGEVLWSRPFGEPFYNRPIVYRETVLIRSSYGSLFGLDAKTGIMKWDAVTPGVDELIACFGSRAYVRMLSGVFAVIDIETGKIVEQLTSVQAQSLLVNDRTNRLYLVDVSGVVQCLKPIGSDSPVLNPAMAAVDTGAEAEADETKPETDKADDMTKPTDPFGAGGTDPFGAGAGAAGNDPFGAGGNDPFGGGAGGDMKDPFGGDPFGN